MLKKRRFLVAFPEELDQSCNQKLALSPLATSLVYKNGCSMPNIASHCEQEYKPVITSKLQRNMKKISMYF